MDTKSHHDCEDSLLGATFMGRVVFNVIFFVRLSGRGDIFIFSKRTSLFTWYWITWDTFTEVQQFWSYLFSKITIKPMKKVANSKHTHAHRSTATCKDVWVFFLPFHDTYKKNIVLFKSAHRMWCRFLALWLRYTFDGEASEVACLDACLHETHCNTFPPDEQAGLLLRL